MRKQYHLRKSARGLLAWDVHRLIELTKNLQAHSIPISSIEELDEAFWFEPTGQPPTCRSVAMHTELIETADLDFPIIIDPNGRVMDGMHRVCKALNLGHKSIEAFQLSSLPDPDFMNIPADQLPYED